MLWFVVSAARINIMTLALLCALAGVCFGVEPLMADNIESPPDAAGIFAIYPGPPPGSENRTWREKAMPMPGARGGGLIVRNVAIPTVTMFKPADGRANGASVIIAPGGAFHFLAMDSGGYDVARWLARLGVTAFVLKYRVAPTPENDADMPEFLKGLFKELRHRNPSSSFSQGRAKILPLSEEDGRQAIRFVRQNAASWGLNPKRIGILGFSAGGVIAASAAVNHDSESRPDFVGCMYAGWRNAPLPEDAPPLFIAIAGDDPIAGPVAAAGMYADWHAAGKPAELHIFAKGGHGFGVKKQNLPSDAWTRLFENWLQFNRFIP